MSDRFVCLLCSNYQMVGFSIFSFKKKKPSSQPTDVREKPIPGSEPERMRQYDVSEESESPADEEGGAEHDEEPPSNETKRYTAQEKGKTVERGESRASYNPPRQPGDEGGMARERARSHITFQRGREERESNDRVDSAEETGPSSTK